MTPSCVSLRFAILDYPITGLLAFQSLLSLSLSTQVFICVLLLVSLTNALSNSGWGASSGGGQSSYGGGQSSGGNAQFSQRISLTNYPVSEIICIPIRIGVSKACVWIFGPGGYEETVVQQQVEQLDRRLDRLNSQMSSCLNSRLTK